MKIPFKAKKENLVWKVQTRFELTQALLNVNEILKLDHLNENMSSIH